MEFQRRSRAKKMARCRIPEQIPVSRVRDILADQVHGMDSTYSDALTCVGQTFTPNSAWKYSLSYESGLDRFCEDSSIDTVVINGLELMFLPTKIDNPNDLPTYWIDYNKRFCRLHLDRILAPKVRLHKRTLASCVLVFPDDNRTLSNMLTLSTESAEAYAQRHKAQSVTRMHGLDSHLDLPYVTHTSTGAFPQPHLVEQDFNQLLRYSSIFREAAMRQLVTYIVTNYVPPFDSIGNEGKRMTMIIHNPSDVTCEAGDELGYLIGMEFSRNQQQQMKRDVVAVPDVIKNQIRTSEYGTEVIMARWTNTMIRNSLSTAVVMVTTTYETVLSMMLTMKDRISDETGCIQGRTYLFRRNIFKNEYSVIDMESMWRGIMYTANVMHNGIKEYRGRLLPPLCTFVEYVVMIMLVFGCPSNSRFLSSYKGIGLRTPLAFIFSGGFDGDPNTYRLALRHSDDDGGTIGISVKYMMALIRRCVQRRFPNRKSGNAEEERKALITLCLNTCYALNHYKMYATPGKTQTEKTKPFALGYCYSNKNFAVCRRISDFFGVQGLCAIERTDNNNNNDNIRPTSSHKSWRRQNSFY